MKKIASFLYIILAFLSVTCFAQDTLNINHLVLPQLPGYTFNADPDSDVFKAAKAQQRAGYHLLGIFTNELHNTVISVLEAQNVPVPITPSQWEHIKSGLSQQNSKENIQTKAVYRSVDRLLKSDSEGNYLILLNSIRIDKDKVPLAQSLYAQTYVYLNGNVYVVNVLKTIPSDQQIDPEQIKVLSKYMATQLLLFNVPTKEDLIAIKMANIKEILRLGGMISLAIILFMMMSLPLRSTSQTIVHKDERKQEAIEGKRRLQDKLKAHGIHGPAILATLLGVLFFFVSVPIILFFVLVTVAFFLFRFLLWMLYCLALLFVGLLIAGWAYQEELKSNEEQIYDLVTSIETSYAPEREIQKIFEEKPKIWQFHLKPQSMPSIQYQLKQLKE